MLLCILIGLLVGVIVELLAWALQLWVYRQPQIAVINIIVMYGCIMGGLAGTMRAAGPLPATLIAFAAGLGYEALNLRVLRWWSFPKDRLAFVHGHGAIVLVLAAAWACLPVAIVVAQTSIPGSQRLLRNIQASLSKDIAPEKPPLESRIEKLNEREKAILEKLEAVRHRVGDLESRLNQVRQAKQALLARQAVIKPGNPGTAFTPPP